MLATILTVINIRLGLNAGSNSLWRVIVIQSLKSPSEETWDTLVLQSQTFDRLLIFWSTLIGRDHQIDQTQIVLLLGNV